MTPLSPLTPQGPRRSVSAPAPSPPSPSSASSASRPSAGRCFAGADSQVSAHAQDAPWLFAGLLVLLVGVVGATISESGIGPKAVAMLGVLAATGAALRPIGAGTAGIEPMFFLMVLSGRVLGPGFGFVLGAVTMFASALLTGGVGPWMPFQMLRWAGSRWARACCRAPTACAAGPSCSCSPPTASSRPSPTARS